MQLEPFLSRGLSESEARRRLERDGPNVLPSARRREFIRILLSTVREPMIALLLAAGAVYAVLGEPMDAISIGVAIAAVIALTLAQELRSERALQALADLSSPRALVIRDAETRRIPGAHVVAGDVMMLAEGDRVPADGELIEAANLHADESLLTGESAPVSIDEETPRVFAGTLIVSGSGVARVTATGERTQMGRIGKSLQTLQPAQTPLQQKTHHLVLKLAAEGLLLSLAAVLVFGLFHKAWLEGVLVGVSAAISLLPEEIPVVLMVFFAIGAWRIAKNNVLTRRLPAIEALGAASVLCVDKTGTLTLNRMRVARALPSGTGAERTVIDYGLLASSAEPYDPMERALHEAAVGGMSGALKRMNLQPSMVRQYPLTRELLAISQIWRDQNGGLLAATKGAPEAVLAMCAMQTEQRNAVLAQAQQLAAQGLRVLAVAARSLADGALADEHRALAPRFAGLLAFEDPVRPGVPESIAECYRAGMRVIMITGDHPATAAAIARSIGLRRTEYVASGSELISATDAQLQDLVSRTDVFARVRPEQKLRLVTALQAAGETVAMTGDGVNDAPALKAADIGVAMGSRGTDVAREAAGLVLLDDDFSSIVGAVRLGRRIFSNVRGATAYIVAVHVLIAGIVLVPAALLLPLVLMPIHIVLLELVVDPACALAFEAQPEAPDAMRQPPRPRDAALLGRRQLWANVLRGAIALAAPLAVLAYTQVQSAAADATRACVFAAVMLANMALIATSVSNGVARALLGGAAAALVLVLTVPQLRELFHFAAPAPAELAVTLASSAAVAALLALLSRAQRSTSASAEQHVRVVRTQ